MKKIIYPDWVEPFRGPNHIVKMVGNNYYLYKRTSKRVPNKKYPQPVDTYVGIITPNGLDKTNRQKVNFQDCIVKEFGYTQTMLMLCPESWKKNNKGEAEDLLKTIIVKHSPESYLALDFVPKEASDFVCSYSAQSAALWRYYHNHYNVEFTSLDILKTIYVVHLKDNVMCT